MQFPEWLKEQQEQWLAQAQALIANLRYSQRMHSNLMERAEDRRHKEWYRSLIEQNQDSIRVVKQQHKRMSIFVSAHGLQMPELE
jgi:hypothetical protein